MDIVTLLVAVVAGVIAVSSVRRANALENRLARNHSLMYEAMGKIESLEEKLHEEILNLRTEMRQRAGEIRFTPTMTIGETKAMHPLAQQVLAGFHLGGCASCAVSDTDTIAMACDTHSIDREALLSALTGLAAQPGDHNDGGFQEPLRLPNIQLQL